MRTPRVLVTRAPEDAPPMCLALEEVGLVPVPFPLLEYESRADLGEVDAALGDVSGGWIVLSSQRALPVLVAAGGPRPGTRVAVVGPMTAQRAGAAGVTVDLVADGSGVAGLARAFSELGEAAAPRRALWLTGNLSASSLGEALAPLGFEVRELEVYRTVPRRPEPKEFRDAVENASAALFMSPSAVSAFVDAAGRSWMREHAGALLTVAIGPTTDRALEREGFPRRRVAEDPRPESVARATADGLREELP